jgi:L-ascorbate 6-phosphate lactonase
MQSVTDFDLLPSEAALWWLGQAGYLIRSANLTVVIDPYLSDSAGKNLPEFSRSYPPPVQAAALNADVYLVTHDHLDHLDPDTLSEYRFAESTWFLAPRFAARKLAELGIPRERIVVLNAGELWTKDQIEVEAVYALPTGIDVLDTVGFLIRFQNGRTIYHTSDTQFHPLVLAAAPRGPEVMLVPINGKWGNPGPEKAAEFAGLLEPRYVMPNHYDLMLLNAENPETFRWFCSRHGIEKNCVVTERMKPFVWGNPECE